MLRIQLSVLACTTLLLPLAARGDEWPQWLGPRHDSVWRETGVVLGFSAQGPKVKFRTPVGLGYSGPAVAGGRVFVTDYVKSSGQIANNPGGRNKLTGKERTVCIDARNGDVLWKYEYDRPYALSYAAGPRCTPVVDGDRVYVLGAEGDLYCLAVKDGSEVWRRSLTKDYKTTTQIWGFAAHPLVHGDLLYCVVGGAGSVAVAFDKRTGREVWKALSASEAGYCPPTLVDNGGSEELLIWHPEALNGLDPASGKVRWSRKLQPNYKMAITAPRKSGDYLFASGIGSIGALYKYEKGEPEVVWRGKSKTAVYSANTTPFIENGVIYGCDCHSGALTAVSMEDGERLWQTFKPTTGNRRGSHGTAYIVKNQDRFVLFAETGDLIFAEFSASGYNEVSRAHIVDPTNECFGRPVVWSHPAFAYRCAFVRNDKELVCVDLAE
ncbi:MAG: PQQ-like beta-propeller repeat protein [Pirellulaceae bacterium]|jgi:outer membrane protein assembly factor BamB|nr:PQQ-like beta-propeller repeat protein [Pirellulaceae bacterium]MDP7018312.1 PQQ-like beta-propeller repeat protein [Pirellulaceae bacterium]